MKILSTCDILLICKTKNAFKEMEEEIQIEIDKGTTDSFAMVVCDVNGLKQVNDEQGHQAGDEYIRAACHMICHIYDHSPVFRIGGGEFVVILRGADYENRVTLLEQMKSTALANQESGGVIVAAGMADYDGDATIAAVFERADKEMYENKYQLKRSGKRTYG